MELTRMKLADLRPNEANIRTEFQGIEELADRLDLTPGAPGEPMIPIVAVRDANVARIIDGERRYRAMKLRGKVEECNVFLCDSMEEADQTIAMLLSNDRENLSREDYSTGLQELLIMNVPEEKVDKMAGKPVSRALRRAVAFNKGKARQLSLDALLAASEVIDAGGTSEDYDLVAGSANYSYDRNRVINRIKDERERKEREAAIAELVESCGLVVVDKRPKGASYVKQCWNPSADTIRKEWPEHAKMGRIVVRPHGYVSYEIYDKPQELSDEEQKALESKNKIKRIRTAGQKRRAEWLYDRLFESGAMSGKLYAIQSFVEDWYEDNREYEHDDFLKRAGKEDGIPYNVNGWMVAAEWCNIDSLTNYDIDHIFDMHALAGSQLVAAERHIKLLRAMERAGYEPTDDEKALVSLCEKNVSMSRERESS